MPKNYEMPHDAIENHGEDMTEQEHKESCDINVMIRKVQLGHEIRGGRATQYGEDDTTMSGLDFRIQKANLERDLAQTAETHEFSESELAMMPPKVAEKFRFKKAGQKPGAKNDEPNDEKTPGTKPAETAKKATSHKTTDE